VGLAYESWMIAGLLTVQFVRTCGSLDDAMVNLDGSISRPWHRYRFNIETGENLDGKCRALTRAPRLKTVQGWLYLSFNG
jgi:nitrite reductase/ring-hydroxylating ferredoxin subunit